jgi:hypothetical protein
MNETMIDDGEPPQDEARRVFEEELATDLRVERMLPWKELLALAVVLIVVLLHQLA